MGRNYAQQTGCMDSSNTAIPRSSLCHIPAKTHRAMHIGRLSGRGVVLDPFMGSGTTGKTALENQRNYIGFDLNPEYIQIHDKRTEVVQIKMVY